MAITISGENNNDRILASDGVIDEISGINIVGLLTAGHINVGNNIQLGNAGIVTATTFVGNVTGNVNSTSPLLLQTDGGERFRITGNNELGIAGGNYGSAGQVLTSGGSGSAVTWSAIPTQVTIANNADNRVITGGSGTNLNGEANLTWDGNKIHATATGEIARFESTNSVSTIRLYSTASSHTEIGHTEDTYIAVGGSERLRIKGSNGNVGIGTATIASNKKLDVCDGIISIQAGHTHDTRVEFYRKNTGALSWIGIPNWDDDSFYIYGPTSNSNEIAAKYSSGAWQFFTSGSSNSEKLSIASDGNVHVNMTDNGTASAKLNVEDSSSAGTNVLLISNKPSGANGKARMVFHTETSQGQGCSPYIQSVSGTDAGPNASDGHNAGGFEFHTRSGGSGTDNNAMRIRDDGTVEKYGSVGQILLKPSGAEIEFTRGSASNILCSNSAGYLNFFTGGHTTYPAMRIFASAGANSSGAKVGINTDSIGVDTQMSIMAPPGYPALYSSYGIRIMPNGANSFGYTGQYISRSSGVYVIHATIPANNTWTQVAAGRYHGATVTARIGDASSKVTIFANYDFTAPNYGVAHYNEIANNGAWNTGGASMRLASAGTYDYALEVQHNSYYNTSNNSSVHLIFNVC